MTTPGRRVIETSEAVLVAAALALTFKGFVFQIYHVPSSSMEDTVLTGDYVLVNKFAYGPHRGPWARVLPYRDLDARGRGRLPVPARSRPRSHQARRRGRGGPDRGGSESPARERQGALEPYAVHRDATTYGTAAPPSLLPRDRFGPLTLQAGRFFAMGDNRDESQDSRFFGPVPLAHLEGRAVSVLWSVRRGPARLYGPRSGVTPFSRYRAKLFVPDTLGKNFPCHSLARGPDRARRRTRCGEPP